MDLYGVSIGVQEVLFYLIKVYEIPMVFRTDLKQVHKIIKSKGERLC